MSPTYVGQQQTDEEKRKQYLDLKRQFALEGSLGDLIELAILDTDQAKKVAEEMLNQAKEMSAPLPLRQLNQTEIGNVRRLAGLIKSNHPPSMQIGRDELEAYAVKLLWGGVCPRDLSAKIAEAMK